MLINALCDYYDILAAAGKVLPDGYSNVNIHFLVSLTRDGKIDEIIKYQKREEVQVGKNKIKERWVPRTEVMPKRTEKPGIEANIIEHRPLYIFGLNYVEGELSPDDATGKAQKSHAAFVETQLRFLEGLETPIVDAYRAFIQNWSPKDEVKNEYLLGLEKDYGKSGFAFCLSGSPELLLHKDSRIKEKWAECLKNPTGDSRQAYIAQCAISGENEKIARIHSKIKGVYGGLATGSVLIGFNNPSESSYNNDQSYNSNISEKAMRKYTEALNYLLSDSKHKTMLEDITVVSWAMNANEDCEAVLNDMLFGGSNTSDVSQTDETLKKLVENARQGKVQRAELESLDKIDPNVDFYMVGLKPNSSRLAVKFIYKKKFADFLWNITKHQNDMQIQEEFSAVSIPRLRLELVSPKSSKEKVNPELIVKLFQSILYDIPYPVSLLETVVRRVKTDTDMKVNHVRAGIIKACINRFMKKEELKVSLDQENNNQAYVCGRLFAVLQRVQEHASNYSLNRTIKDSYFASAASKPVLVFPKLVILAQNHLKKIKYPVFYNKLMCEIMDKLDGNFPSMLSLSEQGEFIVGYHQQYQELFQKNDKNEKNIEEEK